MYVYLNVYVSISVYMYKSMHERESVLTYLCKYISKVDNDILEYC